MWERRPWIRPTDDSEEKGTRAYPNSPERWLYWKVRQFVLTLEFEPIAVFGCVVHTGCPVPSYSRKLPSVLTPEDNS